MRSSVVRASISIASWEARPSACAMRSRSSLSRIDSTWARRSSSWASLASVALREPCSAVARLRASSSVCSQRPSAASSTGSGSRCNAAGPASRRPARRLHQASSSGLIVFGRAAADLCTDFLDRRALACAQQRVGGAVDVGGGDAARRGRCRGGGVGRVRRGRMRRNIRHTYDVVNRTIRLARNGDDRLAASSATGWRAGEGSARGCGRAHGLDRLPAGVDHPTGEAVRRCRPTN